MKLVIMAIFLLSFYFATVYGVDICPSSQPCTNSSKGSIIPPQQMDEFPKDNFTFNCSLPSEVKSFHIKLFKGQSEFCGLYIDNNKHVAKMNEFCNPVYSGNTVSFILRNLNSSISDTYTCCLEKLIPTYGHCKISEKHIYIQQDTEESCLFSKLTSWMLVGLTVFSIAACVISLVACAFTFRAKPCQHSHNYHAYNDEYMSMAAVKPS